MDATATTTVAVAATVGNGPRPSPWSPQDTANTVQVPRNGYGSYGPYWYGWPSLAPPRLRGFWPRARHGSPSPRLDPGLCQPRPATV